jgi:hypothetical protein
VKKQKAQENLTFSYANKGNSVDGHKKELLKNSASTSQKSLCPKMTLNDGKAARENQGHTTERSYALSSGQLHQN